VQGARARKLSCGKLRETNERIFHSFDLATLMPMQHDAASREVIRLAAALEEAESRLFRLEKSKQHGHVSEEDDRMEIHRASLLLEELLHHSQKKAMDDEYGSREIERFVAEFKLKRCGSHMATRAQAWWRMHQRKTVYLRFKARRFQKKRNAIKSWMRFGKAASLVRKVLKRRLILRWYEAVQAILHSKQLMCEMTQGKNELVLSKLLNRVEAKGMSKREKLECRNPLIRRVSPIESEKDKLMRDWVSVMESNNSQSQFEVSRREKMIERVHHMANMTLKRNHFRSWVGFLRNIQNRRRKASFHIIKMARMSRKNEGLWSGERLNIIFQMWYRFVKYTVCVHKGAPLPYFEANMPIWNEWIEKYSKRCAFERHAEKLFFSSRLRRYYRGIRDHAEMQKHKNEKNSLALAHFKQSMRSRFFRVWASLIRKRGRILREKRRHILAWYEWAQYKSKMRIAREFISRNLCSSSKVKALKFWAKKAKKARSLRIQGTDQLLGPDMQRNAQLALKTVFLWKGMLPNANLVDAWCSWKEYCLGRRAWNIANFAYLRTEARKIQRRFFEAWKSNLERDAGMKDKKSAFDESSGQMCRLKFESQNDLWRCMHFRRFPRVTWGLEDEADNERLKSWLLERKRSQNGPTTRLHELADQGDLGGIRHYLSVERLEIKHGEKVEIIERQKRKMQKRMRKALNKNLERQRTTFWKPEDEVQTCFAMLHSRNEFGQTPLHLAAQHLGREYFFVVLELVNCGASILDEDDGGRIPLDYAIDPKIVSFLQSHQRRLETHQFYAKERATFRQLLCQYSWRFLDFNRFWQISLEAWKHQRIAKKTASKTDNLPKLKQVDHVQEASMEMEHQKLAKERATVLKDNLQRDAALLHRAAIREQIKAGKFLHGRAKASGAFLSKMLQLKKLRTSEETRCFPFRKPEIDCIPQVFGLEAPQASGDVIQRVTPVANGKLFHGPPLSLDMNTMEELRNYHHNSGSCPGSDERFAASQLCESFLIEYEGLKDAIPSEKVESIKSSWQKCVRVRRNYLFRLREEESALRSRIRDLVEEASQCHAKQTELTAGTKSLQVQRDEAAQKMNRDRKASVKMVEGMINSVCELEEELETVQREIMEIEKKVDLEPRITLQGRRSKVLKGRLKERKSRQEELRQLLPKGRGAVEAEKEKAQKGFNEQLGIINGIDMELDAIKETEEHLICRIKVLSFAQRHFERKRLGLKPFIAEIEMKLEEEQNYRHDPFTMFVEQAKTMMESENGSKMEPLALQPPDFPVNSIEAEFHSGIEGVNLAEEDADRKEQSYDELRRVLQKKQETLRNVFQLGEDEVDRLEDEMSEEKAAEIAEALAGPEAHLDARFQEQTEVLVIQDTQSRVIDEKSTQKMVRGIFEKSRRLLFNGELAFEEDFLNQFSSKASTLKQNHADSKPIYMRARKTTLQRSLSRIRLRDVLVGSEDDSLKDEENVITSNSFPNYDDSDLEWEDGHEDDEMTFRFNLEEKNLRKDFYFANFLVEDEAARESNDGSTMLLPSLTGGLTVPLWRAREHSFPASDWRNPEESDVFPMKEDFLSGIVQEGTKEMSHSENVFAFALNEIEEESVPESNLCNEAELLVPKPSKPQLQIRSMLFEGAVDPRNDSISQIQAAKIEKSARLNAMGKNSIEIIVNTQPEKEEELRRDDEIEKVPCVKEEKEKEEEFTIKEAKKVLREESRKLRKPDLKAKIEQRKILPKPLRFNSRYRISKERLELAARQILDPPSQMEPSIPPIESPLQTTPNTISDAISLVVLAGSAKSGLNVRKRTKHLRHPRKLKPILQHSRQSQAALELESEFALIGSLTKTM